MGIESRHQTFTLSYADIDRISEWFDAFQVEVGIERRNRLRARLLIEEALIALGEHYGEDHEAEVFLETRFLARPRIRIEVKGERFNPLGAVDDEEDEWSSSFFSSIGLRLQYNHGVDANNLTLVLPTDTMNPVLKIGLAILIGVVVGALGNLVIPASLRGTITNVVMGPVYKVWVRLLGAISGPIIFLTATTTTLNTKRITDQGGSNFNVIVRYFVFTAIVLLFTIVCGRLVFPLGAVYTDTDSTIVSRLLDDAFNIVPDNLIEPLSTANTPQLLLVAFVLGSVLVRIGGEVSELQLIIRQGNVVGLTVAKWVSRLVPYFVGAFLCLEIWHHSYDLLTDLWQPCLVSVAISLVCMFIHLSGVAARMRTNPMLLVAKLKGPFLEVLRCGSLDPAYEGILSSCENLLGIDSEYAKAAMPQGLALYMPVSAVGIYVFSIFVARQQHVYVDQIWVIRAAVLAVVLFIATPPVSGANLLAYVAFFAYLGISESALMDAMLFDVVFGVFSNAANLTMLQLETIEQSYRAGFLDEEVLHASLKDSAAAGKRGR